ncbi:hypothetical protein PpBr36_03871 [Pyricularia pennisetigena]|uniref:hypothetical protein n=1 Tax=Pyricularia pennisetigena TaxID=1578925 RepID=UPI0011523745|nr:hypothetical protein PpBr36_03871 [Pyricularia pennisetigena]TLS31026.1 hypothetical protein PpBr36_03871 [Pyricularia pennisetigena]
MPNANVAVGFCVTNLKVDSKIAMRHHQEQKSPRVVVTNVQLGKVIGRYDVDGAFSKEAGQRKWPIACAPTKVGDDSGTIWTWTEGILGLWSVACGLTSTRRQHHQEKHYFNLAISTVPYPIRPEADRIFRNTLIQDQRLGLPQRYNQWLVSLGQLPPDVQRALHELHPGFAPRHYDDMLGWIAKLMQSLPVQVPGLFARPAYFGHVNSDFDAPDGELEDLTYLLPTVKHDVKPLGYDVRSCFMGKYDPEWSV